MMGVPQRLPDMHRRVLILTSAVSLALMTAVRADDLVLVRFASYLESLRTQAAIPGLAASIVGSRAIMWERGFGRQNIERSVEVKVDTPFHLDGGTQIVTASLVLSRCVEEKGLSLDEPLAGATLRQLLSHTSRQPNGLVFAYGPPERLDALAPVVAACTGESFRRSVADLLEQNAMFDSAPGPDSTTLRASDGFDQTEIDRYKRVMDRLATGYTVNTQGTASTSSYAARTLTPWGGLITTVHDFAKFDLALKSGVVLRRAESFSAAWTAPVGANGRPLPHGLGWFVQSYNGELVVWQFGSGNASSSMVVMIPNRLLTLILLANSAGLTKGFNLAAGDVSVSPFAKAFLGTFLR
jgi:CubicO group peptidase (beta-lactamase class C family)